MIRCLGIDHGRRTGYAVMEDNKVKAVGYFVLSNRNTSNDSFLAFYNECIKLIEQVNPDVIACEYPADMKNAETARQLIGYYTIIKLIAMQKDIKICEVRPMTLKKNVAGKGTATKEEVCNALVKALGIERSRIEIPIMYGDRIAKYKGKVKSYVYDESDALALAYYYFIIGYLTT